jgi:hypothetical protein
MLLWRCKCLLEDKLGVFRGLVAYYAILAMEGCDVIEIIDCPASGYFVTVCPEYCLRRLNALSL